MNLPAWIHLAWLIPAFLFVYYLGTPRFRGTIARDRLLAILSAQLDKGRYSLFHDIDIPSGGGSRRSGILVVSQFGILIINPIRRPGTISGGEFQERWQETRRGRRLQFDNPLHENTLVADSLKCWLGVGDSVIRSLVVFVGQPRFSAAAPPRVIGDCRLMAEIRGDGSKRLSHEACDEIVRKLASLGQRRAPGPPAVARLAMFCVLVLAAGWLYRTELAEVSDTLVTRTPETAPMPQTRQEREETFECAYSVDTGRCTCLDERGNLAKVEPARCQELAKRGSILEQ